MSTENDHERDMETVEDELRKWKAIALAATASQDGQSPDTDVNSKLLVQYLMEKVYQQSKNDFETKMPEIVPYLKVNTK